MNKDDDDDEKAAKTNRSAREETKRAEEKKHNKVIMENCCSLHKQSYYFNKLFTTKVFSLCLSPSRYCPCTLFATAIFIQLRLLLGWVSISIRNLDLDGVSVIVCAVAVCMRVRVSRFSSSPKYNVPTRIIRLWTEKATFLDTPKSNSFTFRFAVTYVMLFLVMLFAFFSSSFLFTCWRTTSFFPVLLSSFAAFDCAEQCRVIFHLFVINVFI